MGWMLIVTALNGQTVVTSSSLDVCRWQYYSSPDRDKITEAVCVNTNGDRVVLFPVHQ